MLGRGWAPAEVLGRDASPRRVAELFGRRVWSKCLADATKRASFCQVVLGTSFSLPERPFLSHPAGDVLFGTKRALLCQIVLGISFSLPKGPWPRRVAELLGRRAWPKCLGDAPWARCLPKKLKVENLGCWITDTLAEWLRRRPAKPMECRCVGSIPPCGALARRRSWPTRLGQDAYPKNQNLKR